MKISLVPAMLALALLPAFTVASAEETSLAQLTAAVAARKNAATTAENYREPPLRELVAKKSIRVKPSGGEDLPAITRAVAEAIAAKVPAEVVFEPGNYRLTPGADHQCVKIGGANQVALRGTGAKWVIHDPGAQVFSILNSSQVIIEGIDVDYDPLPFTQGVVESVSAKGKIALRVDAGFPALNDAMFAGSKKQWFFVKDPKFPGAQKPGTFNVYLFDKVAASGGGKTGTLDVDLATGIEKGDPFVIGISVRPMTIIGNSEQITFLHTTFRTGAGPCFVGSTDSAINLIGHKTLVTGNRLQGNTRDGIIFNSHRVGPWIEDCVFEGQGDDGINLHCEGNNILAKPSANQLRIAPVERHGGTGASYFAKPGDEVEVYDSGLGRVIYRAKVQESKALGEEKQDLTLDKPVSDLVKPGNKAQALYNASLSCPGFVIRNNVLTGARRYELFIQSHHGLIENNVIARSSSNGAILTFEPMFDTGCVPRDIAVRNNLFVDCYIQKDFPSSYKDGHVNPPGALSSMVKQAKGDDFKSTWWNGMAGFVVENNAFVQTLPGTGPAINLLNANDPKVSGNRVYRPKKGASAVLVGSNVEDEGSRKN